MNNKTIEIKKENVIAAYRAASEDKKELLEMLFGKDLFKPKDIRERIKTFEDACRELRGSHPFVTAYRQLLKIATREDYMRGTFDADMVAYLKLRIICAALSEGWEPQFTKDEKRYSPWFWLYTREEIDNMDEGDKERCHLISTDGYQTGYAGFAYADSNDAPSYAYASVGSCLCLKSYTLAEYCGKQFIDLWADFYLIRK